MFMKLYNLFLILVISSIHLLSAQQLMPTYQSTLSNSIENKKSIQHLTANQIIKSNNTVSIKNAELENIADIYLLGSNQISFADCTHLYLQNNKLDENLFEPLFNTLTNLTKLDVSDNNITKLPLIKSKFLQYLNISNNQITELNLQKIAEYLPALRTLIANNNHINTLHENELETFVKDNPTKGFYAQLQNLQLSGNELTLLNLRALLNALEKLENLDLSSNLFTQIDSDHVVLRTVVPTINFKNTFIKSELIQKILNNSCPSLKVKTPHMLYMGGTSLVSSEMVGLLIFVMGLGISSTPELFKRITPELIAEYVFPIVTTLWFIGFCIYAKKAEIYQKVYIPQFHEQNTDIENGTGTQASPEPW